jgi:hypothetical protein
MKSGDRELKFNLVFFGSCAIAAGRKREVLVLEAQDSSPGYFQIFNSIQKLMKNGMPFIILCRDRNLQDLLAQGYALGPTEELTIVPVLLGG